ncbi:transcriptional regulator, HxlR family [Filimonas lacunae]|uniref:Transcriptional regulator, HxlR family n=1 Tax=Filimonas lacunae TaxID=477680 RepID=A0A173MJW8_9BACT|nr:helix-turn-helix domain-containing protein [Filimonas lacunae]BAV07933.1 transcriptional regulator, HxlR family [Filimonas lacunae]SIT06791.1 transcriptional regulator, HxlR family [Filimonas lacunae]
MKKETENEVVAHTEENCKKLLLPVQDALDVLNGRWKLPILIAISFTPKRFSQISKEVNGITDRVLSKELKEMEQNKLITRTVYDAFPPVVAYAVTEHGRTLHKIYGQLGEWGDAHRRLIMGK